MSIDVRPLTGAALQAALPDLARLRIAVFAAWPYLYAGSEEYEQDYLAEFTACPDAVLVAALDGERIVGAATASPLIAQEDYIRAPFVTAGIDPAGVFYFGESVLLPEYRGQGIGHAFFDHREAAARAWGARQASFCAVVRPTDHPARPADYVPLDAFWGKRGYAPVSGLVGSFAWADHGEQEENLKPMQYWMRQL
ncbi:GNAT family N-acetyltransferase [Novosphingobium sp.]|jgi:GNAT superfamily N-acetyltransferase|uniref:GNAT family N-acetyltransferase n=1 Tax=Novosphingobium sp. TaxID=1874826 RepID=UPI0022CCDE58|nr:GNAT family N-acetyltransferase [Novosphingobium sp.]MCZ8017817.1 GNAT family N-acetyltransferase [Novosphingobium sp.]MCZ8033659.1 GNAT family N-acetyltransferase [Novosphingobium sp.]MCZ8051015.1 GNAT family N-acetyltransferase [Novosphingobium sp.]MCZ8059361.1 GNAT family N-acetyltransferase [Novosphingobium sp.]MCZ8231199.1 GNAT family N-acetyltransferase [Novosphingobium sp.]